HASRIPQSTIHVQSLKSSIDKWQSSIDSVHQQTTVHFNRFSREITGLRRGKKGDDCGCLFRSAGIFEWNHIDHSFHLLWAGEAFVEWGKNHAGSHSIDADAIGRKLFGKSFGESQDGTFGGCVGNSARTSSVSSRY